jgi:hypothetical protein
MHKDNKVENSVEKKDHLIAARTPPLLGDAIARLQEILAAAPSSTINRFLRQPLPGEASLASNAR